MLRCDHLVDSHIWQQLTNIHNKHFSLLQLHSHINSDRRDGLKHNCSQSYWLVYYTLIDIVLMKW